MRWVFVWVALGALCGACEGQQPDGQPNAEAGVQPSDAARPEPDDAGRDVDATPDAAVPDAALLDQALPADAAPLDQAVIDQAVLDAAPPDAEADLAPDAASPDALPDLAAPDADPADQGAPDVAPPPRCDDGIRNGAEADQDCGGPDCAPCRDGRACGDGADCRSGVCAQGACAVPACDDGQRNGSEADVDCGGARCAPCALGRACDFPEDCASGQCEAQRCVGPACDDGQRNGAEVDVDCGGDCDPCPAGAACGRPADCASGLCVAQVCCGADDPACNPPAFGGPPTVSARDYSYWYWPGNHRPQERWPAFDREMHFLTGHYGLAWDEATGALLRLGALPDAPPMSAAAHVDNAVIAGLPAAALTFEAAGQGGLTAIANRFRGADGGQNDIARMTDGGRTMNRVEIPHVRYAGGDGLEGWVEVAAMPRHVVFTHRVTGSALARIRLGGEVLDRLTEVQWLAEGRALQLTDRQGQGWAFFVYDQAGATTTLSYAPDRGLVAERQQPGADRQQVSLLAVPTHAVNAAERALYLNPAAAVGVRYTLLDAAGQPAREPEAVPWDETLGAFRSPLRTLRAAGLQGAVDYDARPELHSLYGRHRIELTPQGPDPVAVPLAFFGGGGASLYITGGAPLLRDPNGEPVGVPVQVSKNWHDPPAWYHLYALPVLGGEAPQTLELTLASSRWGAQAYAASHAQLSLIGWNAAGGHWDESALGCFGESVTYDPDVTLGRAMIDDVRPFLVQSVQRWNWTGNVGGADFLRYRRADSPNVLRRLARVRSTYRDQAPNLTHVTYSGVTTDGAIQADLTVQLGRTDDLVRVLYTLDYRFLQDVAYDRLAFFQMAADRYADNGFARFAWGNAEGVLADREVPDHRATGYATPQDRGIPIEGAAPWVMLYDNQRIDERLPEHFADLVFIVRHFEGRIGDAVLRTPHINLHRTNNGQSQVGFELGLPHVQGSPWCGAPCAGETRFVPAGSTVRAVVEALVPPADAARYYGASAYLTALDPAVFSSTDLAVDLAAGNQLSVTPHTGALRATYPVTLDAAEGPVAAEFTLRGGRGYQPVVVHGLPRHDGWRLQRQTDAGWTTVDQAVHGNDYWQARFDGERGAYALTWNVENVRETRYRVAWRP